MQNISAEQNANRNIGFYRVVCEKHEYITVTQTTTQNVGGVTSEIKREQWMQCSKCGKLLNNEQRF
jgi:hypothetical protein